MTTVHHFLLLCASITLLTTAHAGRDIPEPQLNLRLVTQRPTDASQAVHGYSPEYLRFLVQGALSQATAALSSGQVMYAARVFAPYVTLLPPTSSPMMLYSPMDKQNALQAVVDKNLAIAAVITRVLVAKDGGSMLTRGAADRADGSASRTALEGSTEAALEQIESAAGEVAVHGAWSNDLKKILTEGTYTLTDKKSQEVKGRGSFTAWWVPLSPFQGSPKNDMNFVALSRVMWTKY